jgi:hypothetical protein
MKSGFKDRTAIKKQKPEDDPKDGNKSPWDFRCPEYDQRSSCFVNAGTHYGVGVNQPIGTEKQISGSSYAVPVGHPSTMRVDEKG